MGQKYSVIKDVTKAVPKSAPAPAAQAAAKPPPEPVVAEAVVAEAAAPEAAAPEVNRSNYSFLFTPMHYFCYSICERIAVVFFA